MFSTKLWLRSALIEQWRRTRLSERAAFEARADRILSALSLKPDEPRG